MDRPWPDSAHMENWFLWPQFENEEVPTSAAVILDFFITSAFALFCSVQDDICALRKVHMRSTLGFRSFPSVAFEIGSVLA